jgi:hypothetical protein
MNNSISVLAKEDNRGWDRFVPTVQFAYNASAHAATGLSPFMLNTGRIPRMPGEGETPRKTTSNLLEHAGDLRDTIQRQVEETREVVSRYWSRMKARYDANRKDRPLLMGSWVLVRLSDYERSAFDCLKLAPRWSAPCRVIAVKSNGKTYDIQRETGRVDTVNIARLLPLDTFVNDSPPEAEAAATPATQPPRVVPADESDADTERDWLPDTTLLWSKIHSSAADDAINFGDPTKGGTPSGGTKLPVDSNATPHSKTPQAEERAPYDESPYVDVSESGESVDDDSPIRPKRRKPHRE